MPIRVVLKLTPRSTHAASTATLKQRKRTATQRGRTCVAHFNRHDAWVKLQISSPGRPKHARSTQTAATADIQCHEQRSSTIQSPKLAGLRRPLLRHYDTPQWPGPGPGSVCSLFFFDTYWCTDVQCGTGVVEQKLTRTDMHMRSRDGGAGTCEQGARPAGGGGDGGGHRRARGLAVAEVRVHVPCTLARRHIPTSRPRRDVRQDRAAACLRRGGAARH